METFVIWVVAISVLAIFARVTMDSLARTGADERDLWSDGAGEEVFAELEQDPHRRIPL